VIIQLETELAENQKNLIFNTLSEKKLKLVDVKTQLNHYLVALGKVDFDLRQIGNLEGIRDIHVVTDTYQLVSKKWKTQPTHLDLGEGVVIGEGKLALMAGPCSIEDEAKTEKIASYLAENGVKIMRGGVFKPRSSPYSFRGTGIDGLKMFFRICRKYGIKIISEVMQVSQIEAMHDFIDVFQVGARNTQNFNLLDELGKVDKPVLIKRGISGSIDELLQSAEYVFSGGNEKLILCERGIRTFETASRNTLDLNAIPILKEKSHLPVVVDPSHGIGIREFVEPMALAAIAAGANGILIEIHEEPEKAASDGAQTLNFEEASQLINRTRQIFELRQSW
jgi:3-deoxy-7-phosphoheptulonate synthase